MKRRPPKKSESIEVRLPYAMKEAFITQCREQDITASAAIRAFVEQQIQPVPLRRPRRFVRPVLAAGMLAALGGAVAVAPAASAPNFGRAFALLDKNRDGAISPTEYGDRKQRFLACDGPLAVPLRRMGFDKGSRPFAVRVDDAAFATIDRDGNGQVSRSEFAVHRLTMWHQGYASLDKNSDGSLDAREYAAAKKIVFLGTQPDIASFTELDSDRDGRITWREYLA